MSTPDATGDSATRMGFDLSALTQALADLKTDIAHERDFDTLTDAAHNLAPLVDDITQLLTWCYDKAEKLTHQR